MRRGLAVLATLGLLVSLSGVAAGGVAAGKPIKDNAVRHTGPNYNNGAKLPFGKPEGKIAKPPLGPAKVGQTRTWLGLDDTRGTIGLKNYTLRGVGTHVEVWVANNLSFPNPTMLNPLTSDPADFFTYNDCRNDGVRNAVTDDQVNGLIAEFDGTMYPIEADWWGIPPNRAGKHAVLPKLIPNLPSAEYKGEGDNVVVLVDNVRDDNFYDPDNANSKSYIAGFYYSLFDDYFDRTVMSIDAWDWVHRTGADPDHAPTTDPCTSAPARPYLYEGVFAHEYQHLLHHYIDSDEVNWVNEGLSDFSEVITGYADLSKHVDEMGYESHTQCYLGWLSVAHPQWNPIPKPCGPENSLTAWEDQGGAEVLADYGFAMYFINFAYSQGLDKDFFTSWMHNPANGIDGMELALAEDGSTESFQSLFEDEIISALIDGYLDNGVAGYDQYRNAAAEATINFTANANSTTGAPPWGADYIDLGDGALLTSVEFNGDDQFAFPGGTAWVVDGGYFTNPDVAGEDFYNNELDVSMARNVSGHDGQVLSFDHYFGMETGWDYGFVQVSADGSNWTSLGCDGTTSSPNPDADANIASKVPGYTGPTEDPAAGTTTGTAGAPIHATCPGLPAGTQYLAFRLMTDSLVQFDGWHVKNIRLDGANVGTPGELTGWDNQAFFAPVVFDFGLALVGINGTVDAYGDIESGGGDSVTVIRPTLDGDEAYTLTSDDLADLGGFDRVVAVIWGIPADESSTLYQPYSLLVNGDERADGS